MTRVHPLVAEQESVAPGVLRALGDVFNQPQTRQQSLSLGYGEKAIAEGVSNYGDISRDLMDAIRFGSQQPNSKAEEEQWMIG